MIGVRIRRLIEKRMFEISKHEKKLEKSNIASHSNIINKIRFMKAEILSLQNSLGTKRSTN